MSTPYIWDVEREIFSVGSLALRWYSVLFALGILLGYFIIQRMFVKEGKRLELMDPGLMYVVIGTVVGARLGHCLLYEPMDYLTDPLRIFKVWEGGLASHGGFAGVMIGLWLYAKRFKDEISFYWIADRVTIPAMLTGGFIRIGNLFNSEILGRASDGPWAVVFKKVDEIPRHPTQLYEAAGYLTIAALVYGIYRLADRKPREGMLFGLVMVVAYAFRLYIETFKENQVAFEDGMALNMGQLLSIPFIAFGLLLIFNVQTKVPFLRRGLSPEAGGPRLEPQTAAAPASPPKSRRGEVRRLAKKAAKAKK